MLPLQLYADGNVTALVKDLMELYDSMGLHVVGGGVGTPGSELTTSVYTLSGYIRDYILGVVDDYALGCTRSVPVVAKHTPAKVRLGEWVGAAHELAGSVHEQLGLVAESVGEPDERSDTDTYCGDGTDIHEC